MQPAEPFSELNDLERALKAAAEDPVKRGDFTLLLLGSTVVVPGQPTHASAPSSTELLTMRRGESVEFTTLSMPDGTTAIPFYTSRRALESCLTEPTTFLELPVRAFFEMTAGSVLLLNYGATWEKRFEPKEVEQLLAHGWAGHKLVLDHPQAVQLGTPNSEPTALLAAMTSVVVAHGTVRAAYLGVIRYPDSPTQPHLLVGLVGDDDIESVLPYLGPVAAEIVPECPTDFIIIPSNATGVARWLLNHGDCWFTRPDPQDLP